MPHTFQRFISFILLVILAPLIVLLCFFSWISTGRLPIFSQKRIGKNGKEFLIHKIRTVKQDYTYPVWPTEIYPYRTTFGRILRRFWLDEIIQLYDVLLGNMNLVGPRPEMTIFSEYFEMTIKNYSQRHQNIYPGITGLSQVKGFRNNTDIDIRLELDLEYIRKRNFIFDFKLILLTILEIFTNHNYKKVNRKSENFAHELTHKVNQK